MLAGENARLCMMFLCGLGVGCIVSWWVFWYVISQAVRKPDP